jgi:hypothetical protein
MNTLKTLVLFCFFVVGIILAVYNSQIDSDILDNIKKQKPVPSSLINASKGILVISALLIYIPISILICTLRCEKEKQIHSFFESDNIYAFLSGALAITLIVLGVIININSQILPNSSPQAIWASGIGVFVLAFLLSNFNKLSIEKKN